MVLLKSLMPACLFNIVGFGSTFKTLFPASRSYCEVGDGLGEVLGGAGLSRLLPPLLLSQESLAVACESIRRIRADMGGTNILSPLKWVVRQPIPRGHPRLLFLLTDGAVGDTGKVLELLRNHSSSTRYGARRPAGKKPGVSRVGCQSSPGGCGSPSHRYPCVRNRGRRAGCCEPRENLKGFGTDPRSSDAF